MREQPSDDFPVALEQRFVDVAQSVSHILGDIPDQVRPSLVCIYGPHAHHPCHVVRGIEEQRRHIETFSFEVIADHIRRQAIVLRPIDHVVERVVLVCEDFTSHDAINYVQEYRIVDAGRHKLRQMRMPIQLSSQSLQHNRRLPVQFFF